MHSKNYRTIVCLIFSMVLCSSIHAQIGCLCDDRVEYKSVENSEKYDYQFFYRKIKDTDRGSCTIYDEWYMYYIWEKIINSDTIIHRAVTFINRSPDKSEGDYVRWHNVECCDSQIKGYLVITEKSTKRQQIISFPILFMEHEYWFYCCEFKEGVFRVSRWSSYTRDTDLVPCENDLPQYILESCQNYSINKTKRTRKHSIQERQP